MQNHFSRRIPMRLRETFIKFFCFCLLLVSTQRGYADQNLSVHLQMIVVTSEGWDKTQGTLSCFERNDAKTSWTQVGETKPVLVGKTGMANGLGLYPVAIDNSIPKAEGDKKSACRNLLLGNCLWPRPKSGYAAFKARLSRAHSGN